MFLEELNSKTCISDTLLKLLDGFNLTVEPGTSVALVEHSEYGKSNAFKLLTRLYVQEDGLILIAGYYCCNKYVNANK
ncbi:unnamed protein product [Caenorhabditis nigoni]